MQENQSGGTKYQYHPELIALFNSAVSTSAIAGNFISPLLFVYAVNEFIPTNLLIVWVIVAFIVGFSRIFVANKLSKIQSDKNIQLTIITTVLGGSVWGVATIFAYLYAPEVYIYFTLTVVVGIVAAASSTLTPIYKAYLYYAIVATTPLAIVFFLKSENLYFITALLIIVFTIFVLLGGYKHYKKLHEAIILKIS